MRRAIVLGGLLAAAALSLEVAAFQQPSGRGAVPAPMVVEADKLKDNLYVLKGGGGNTAMFITATGVVVVDTKLPGWGQPLLAKIKTLTDKPVTTIINTHTHFDHVSGNVEFPATVEVITQENTKTYMDQANPVYGLQTGQQPNIFKENGGRGMPKRTFKDRLTVGRGADQIDLYYFGPAHTGGDAYVVFPALRVMHVGDTFPTKDLPIMDVNNGGTGIGFAATLSKAAQVSNVDTIINGHSATTTTPADLRQYAEFIGDFVKTVQDAKRAGKTLDDVVKAWTTPAKYAGYGTPQANRVKADVQVVWDESPNAPGQQANLGYDDTPMQPNGRWHIHDGKRPQPTVVTPGPMKMGPAPAPADATVLVGDRDDLSAWRMTDGSAATWMMKDGILETGKGILRTKAEFTDFQLHVEFATPSQVKGDSQGRGNSGVFLLGAFEIQVLDSYQNPTYPDGQAAAMYGQYPPLVNASRPPGEWQTYDMVFTAPRFAASGTLEKPAVVTVLHNGVVVHHATPFWGPTAHRKIDPYTQANEKGPIALQDHGNPVRYRNVWIRPLAGESGG